MSNDWIYGIHAVESIITQSPELILELWIENNHKEKLQHIIELSQQQSIPTQLVSRKTLDKKCPDLNHQGIIARCRPTKLLDEKDLPDLLKQPTFWLILDGIQDPHNLGACLRSAAAFGADGVIIPKDKAVGITPTVRKVASGAVDKIPIIMVTNLVRTIEYLKKQGVWIYGLAGETQENFLDLDLTGNIALVLGSEEKGLRRLTREACDALVAIRMENQMESLNVSVTAGVVLFEVRRQREH